MKVTIVYDNNAKDGLNSGLGFSCLIEGEKNILFDCGDKGKELIENMKKLRIEPSSIDIIVLSHDHWDHTGGLDMLLDLTDNVTVVIPVSFSDETKDIIKGRADVIEIDEARKISSGIYTTGELESDDSPNEQSLIIKTKNGVVVITGCSHPGVGKIIKKAQEMGNVHRIIGGFHGFSDFSLLKDIEILSPCHCTKHIDEIRKLYPKNFREIKAGSVIDL